METIIEMGKISSRGQIAIPSDIRNQLGLTEGTRVLFMLEDNVLFMKKVIPESFAELTEPFRKANKKIKEGEVSKLVHKLRKK
ncbi:MAG: AbrB/MazE/SpoVT family DNA-binding domain-containing protein [Nanoarchaeota archaeon]|nr:AbrB/MazE/SpoVT family DNA-binding domain-containing protein [Nanoarchaeota archaeon]